MRKIISISLVASQLLTACADPIVVRHGVTGPMACTHIESELQSARLALKEAKKEDKFKLQYILIVPAVISIYRMNEAQEAARKRIDELELLYQRQACNSQNTGIPTPRTLNDPSFGNPIRMMEPPSLAPLSPPEPVTPSYPMNPQQQMPYNNPQPMPWQNAPSAIPTPQAAQQPVPLWQRPQFDTY